MVRRDGAAIRKERIQEIARKIQSLLHKQSEISLSKTVAMLQYEFGLTKDKILEYFQVLESLEHFALDLEGNRIKKAEIKEDMA
jgi:hypothetical protein